MGKAQAAIEILRYQPPPTLQNLKLENQPPTPGTNQPTNAPDTEAQTNRTTTTYPSTGSAFLPKTENRDETDKKTNNHGTATNPNKNLTQVPFRAPYLHWISTKTTAQCIHSYTQFSRKTFSFQIKCQHSRKNHSLSTRHVRHHKCISLPTRRRTVQRIG